MRKNKTVLDENWFGRAKRAVSDFFYNLTQPIYAKFRKKKKIASKSAQRRSELIFYFSLMALPLLQFVIFYIMVSANSFLLAFQKWDSTKNSYYWVGFKNISSHLQNIADGGIMAKAVISSLKAYLYTLLLTPLRILFPYYIHKKLPFSGFFKVMLFLPHVLSTMVLAFLYAWFVNSVIPAIGEAMGVNVPILMSDTDSAFFMAWLYTGIFGFTNVLMYLGAMSSVSTPVEEAARIDGCNILQEFWYITLPIIFPTVLVYLISGVSGIFSNQLNLHVYHNTNTTRAVTVGFLIFVKSTEAGSSRLGYTEAASIGIICTAVVTPVVIVLRRIAKKFERY